MMFENIKKFWQSFFVPTQNQGGQVEKPKPTIWKLIVSFVVRNVLLIALGLLSLYAVMPDPEEFFTIRMIVIVWSVASILSGISIFTFTNLPFTKILLQGEDNKYSVYERAAMVELLGKVYLANFLLTAITVCILYLAQYSPTVQETPKYENVYRIDTTQVK
jgi:hypothetical protein